MEREVAREEKGKKEEIGGGKEGRGEAEERGRGWRAEKKDWDAPIDMHRDQDEMNLMSLFLLRLSFNGRGRMAMGSNGGD